MTPAPVFAEFRGTDMWSNLVPSGGLGGLADRHPISYYALDYHVDVEVTDTGDTPALIAQWFASQLFSFLAFFMRMVISAFDWAFNADILTGRKGALTPVQASTEHLYATTIAPLFATGVLVFAAWLTSKVLARKFGAAGTGAIRVVCLTAACLVLIFHADDTIGRAAQLSNGMSAAIVSGTTGGKGAVDVSDRLFDTFIYKPWVVLQFGGLERCTGTRKDDDGYPLAVGTDTPAATTCHNAVTKYAPRFLKYGPGSDQRDAEYEALKNGRAPDSTLCNAGARCTTQQFDGYRLDRTDAVAVDMMQAGGAMQRLTFVVILAVGIIGAILLLGLLCCAALFVQVGLLIAVAVAPAMLLAALVPALHGFFWSWARLVGKLLIAKVAFSLILSAAVGISAAVMAAGGVTGYLYAFAFQAVLFLGLFVKRKAIAAQLTDRSSYQRTENKAVQFTRSAATTAVAAAASPVAAAGTAAARVRQEPAPRPPAPANQPAPDQPTPEPAPDPAPTPARERTPA